MNNAFHKAVKSESKLRMALAGPSGAGKTYTALAIATELAAGAPVAVIDTERGSASKYADLFQFDVLELDNFHPDRYVEAIQMAQDAGYAVLVIDSLSHAWNGTGGALELHDQAVRRQKTQNSYTAWADITPIQNRLTNAITGARLHVIATMRSKTEYVQDKNERGGTTIRKVGMAAVQRDGMEYEFDIFGQMTIENDLIIEKSRCTALASQVIRKPGADVAETLAEWLHGEAPVEAPAPRSSALPADPMPPVPKPARTPSALRGGPTEWMTDTGYNPLADAALRKRLAAVGVSSVAQVEQELAIVREQHDYTREEIYAAVGRLENETAAFNPSDLSDLPVGVRGN